MVPGAFPGSLGAAPGFQAPAGILARSSVLHPKTLSPSAAPGANPASCCLNLLVFWVVSLVFPSGSGFPWFYAQEFGVSRFSAVFLGFGFSFPGTSPGAEEQQLLGRPSSRGKGDLCGFSPGKCFLPVGLIRGAVLRQDGGLGGVVGAVPCPGNPGCFWDPVISRRALLPLRPPALSPAPRWNLRGGLGVDEVENPSGSVGMG